MCVKFSNKHVCQTRMSITLNIFEIRIMLAGQIMQVKEIDVDVDVDVDVVDLQAQADASMPASNNNVKLYNISNF